jgi:hypothetical protein
MATSFDGKTVIFRKIKNIFKVQQSSTQWDPISFTVILYIHSGHIMATSFDRKTVIFRTIKNIFKVQQSSTQWDPISFTVIFKIMYGEIHIYN